MVSRIAEKTQKNLDGLQLETSSWGEQFHAAMNVNGGDVEDATKIDYVLHFITFFWKVGTRFFLRTNKINLRLRCS